MALGRPLNALLSESRTARQKKEQLNSEVSPMPVFGARDKDESQADGLPSSDKGMVSIPLSNLIPSRYQPRQFFNDDTITELCQSIKEHGVLDPLLVRKSHDGQFEIICGERRYRAAKMAGLNAVPCIVTDVLEAKAYAIALVENLQREDLNPLEQAQAFSTMMKELGLTQEQLALTLGKSRSAVANFLRLNSLDEAVKEYLVNGQIDMGHAKALLALEDPTLQSKTAQIVVQRGLNVRQTELFVKQIKEQGQEDKPQDKAPRPAFFDDYEKRLTSTLGGAKVRFTVSGQGKGKLTLSYVNDEQLHSIMELLGLEKESAAADADRPDL